jgi:C1A family cysteine protease
VKTEECLGGHAVLCVGYDMDEQVFIFRNSWGPDWGMNGYFTLPFTFVLCQAFCEDFWVIRQLS